MDGKRQLTLSFSIDLNIIIEILTGLTMLAALCKRAVVINPAKYVSRRLICV